MKKSIIYLSIMACFGCSSSGGDDSPVDPDTENGVSIAVNDVAVTTEDKAVVIQNPLANDVVLDNARITSFDTASANGGTIEDNRNGTYTYTPTDGFIGDDTFTYTLCDSDTQADCSTATVTITVTDEGNPIAENDAVNVLSNSSKVISTLLENDSAIDNAVITSVDNAGTLGTVALNDDGTVTYTAQSGYIGDDTFTYTICDDDVPTPECSTATVTISVLQAINFNMPASLGDYYDGVIFAEDSDLMFDEISNHTQVMHTVILTYTQRHDYLYNADADLSNQDNVILMYTGESRYWEEYSSGNNPYATQTYNTEHIFPQSRLSSDIAVSDLHHLRSADADVNSDRSNYPYADGSGSNKLIGGNTWYPGDEWRGDVARMVMYLNIRYGEDFNKVGGLELFKAWNVADPVSAFEEQRNNVIYAAQGNRNPFIDNPYIATLIWGGTAAENKWE
ncbi:endonuclease [Algibacter lectus]|uniref:endonuclease n=1 Tax=Algibacter lectus TaxID=221126 RepID=UPI002495330A|nr:endonuclease [Algibacter lectus]